MFNIRNISKRYPNGVEPIHGLSATIRKGDVIALIGPSGTGKSTFMRCLNMLDPATSGSITYKGEDIMAKDYDINKLRMQVGMVFQSFNLFNHLTAIENIMMPQTKLLKRSRQEAFDKGMALLGAVGLKDRYLAYPAQLSGGQKQRVAIARTMAMDPEVLLLDEPTSALDPTMVEEVEDVIQKFVASGVTTLIVTHDMGFAHKISNRVFFMDEGVVYEEGTPEQIFEDPQRPNTVAFIRHQTVLEADLATKDFDYLATLAKVNEMRANSNLSNETWTRAAHVFDEILQTLKISTVMQELQPYVMLGFGKQIDLRLDYGGPQVNYAEAIQRWANQTNASVDTVNWMTTSAKIIRTCTSGIEYSYHADEHLPNRIEFHIRGD